MENFSVFIFYRIYGNPAYIFGSEGIKIILQLDLVDELAFTWDISVLNLFIVYIACSLWYRLIFANESTLQCIIFVRGYCKSIFRHVYIQYFDAWCTFQCECGVATASDISAGSWGGFRLCKYCWAFVLLGLLFPDLCHSEGGGMVKIFS